jgi:hypothetical protein
MRGVHEVLPQLNLPQSQFLALPHKFRAFVAGFGSGKTWVGCSSLCQHFWEFPRIPAGYFAPTYAQIRDIFFPTVEEVAHEWGLRTVSREANKEVHLYSGRTYRGTVICRSMEKPETIVGFKIGKALIDELDVLKKDKAQLAWRKIIARMRAKAEGLANGIDVTTTPEGFQFVHHQWVKEVRAKPELASLYGMVQASTYDNELNLPADYIPSLLASYPQQLIEAYLDGQFVNLMAGTVYHAYKRDLNGCSDVPEGGESIHIGMDFNVGKMAGIVHVVRQGEPRAAAEIIDAYDTPDMIRRVKETFWQHDGNGYRKSREITVYPDASGGSRRSVNAAETDIRLLRDAGFHVSAPDANPPVKDRVNAMNAMFCNAQGQRRYRVNATACPVYADHLEQQVWAPNGEPDKSAGTDHTNDAGGYFIHRMYPLIKPVRTHTTPLLHMQR